MYWLFKFDAVAFLSAAGLIESLKPVLVDLCTSSFRRPALAPARWRVATLGRYLRLVSAPAESPQVLKYAERCVRSQILQNVKKKPRQFSVRSRRHPNFFTIRFSVRNSRSEWHPVEISIGQN